MNQKIYTQIIILNLPALSEAGGIQDPYFCHSELAEESYHRVSGKKEDSSLSAQNDCMFIILNPPRWMKKLGSKS